jgi:hypothetical protein
MNDGVDIRSLDLGTGSEWIVERLAMFMPRKRGLSSSPDPKGESKGKVVPVLN